MTNHLALKTPNGQSENFSCSLNVWCMQIFDFSWASWTGERQTSSVALHGSTSWFIGRTFLARASFYFAFDKVTKRTSLLPLFVNALNGRTLHCDACLRSVGACVSLVSRPSRLPLRVSSKWSKTRLTSRDTKSSSEEDEVRREAQPVSSPSGLRPLSVLLTCNRWVSLDPQRGKLTSSPGSGSSCRTRTSTTPPSTGWSSDSPTGTSAARSVLWLTVSLLMGCQA